MLKIIFFQPHPDDLELFCTHLLHYLSNKSEKKYEIKIAAMTNGEEGIYSSKYESFKGERLGKIRKQELLKALKYRGIKPFQVYFFGFINNNIKLKACVNSVKNFLEKEKPDIIFAPEPFYTYYQHKDHIITGKILLFIYKRIIKHKIPRLFFIHQ